MGVVGRLRFARKPICVIGESLKYKNTLQFKFKLTKFFDPSYVAVKKGR